MKLFIEKVKTNELHTSFIFSSFRLSNCHWFKTKNKTNLKLLLAFSGSFLLSLTVMHLLPDVYESGKTSIGIFIMFGILFQIILEFFSKGAEHGHVHGHDKLTQMPWLLFISLCIHAF